MYRIMIQKQRSFIVDKSDVIKGGKERVYPANSASKEKVDVELCPGKFVYEVTDRLGKILELRPDVFVVDVIDDKTGKSLPRPERASAVNPTVEILVEHVSALKKRIEELEAHKKG